MEKVNITVGRFQPFTLGHMKCVEGPFKDKGLRTVICMIDTKDNKVDYRHPFPSSKTLPLYKKTFKNNEMIADFILVKNADIVAIAELCRAAGYEIASWSCGTDRFDAYSKMSSRYAEKAGLADDFVMYEVKRGGEDISATKVRQALKDDDMVTFKKMMSKELYNEYNVLREMITAIKENHSMRSLYDYLTESYDDWKGSMAQHIKIHKEVHID